MKTFSNVRRSRMTAVVIGVSALGMTLAGCAGSTEPSTDADADAGEVLVYDGGGAWGDAQRTAFFEPFEAETGIKVVPVAGDSPAAMRTAIEQGKPTMDVIDLPGTDLEVWADAKLLEPIESSAWTLAEPADFSPYAVEEFGVPSLIFAAQIGWDSNVISTPIESWAAFWDTKATPGTRALGTGTILSTGIFEAALLADGVAKDDLYPLDIDRAFDKLSEIRPDILKFWETGAESAQLLADGQVAALGAWNGRLAALQEEIPTVESTWSEALLSVDYWGVTIGAKNAENAQKFIEFASQPERQAEFASLITYAPTNAVAYDSIDKDRQVLLPTAPDYVNDVIAIDNAFWNSDSGDGTPWSEEIVNRWQKWLSE